MFQVNFDRWVTIEQPNESQDASNQVTVVWNTLCEVRAQYKPIRTTDKIHQELPYADDMAHFTIRYTNKLNPKMRLKMDGEYFYIVGYPQELARRHYLRLVTRRADHNGLQL